MRKLKICIPGTWSTVTGWPFFRFLTNAYHKIHDYSFLNYFFDNCHHLPYLLFSFRRWLLGHPVYFLSLTYLLFFTDAHITVFYFYDFQIFFQETIQSMLSISESIFVSKLMWYKIVLPYQIWVELNLTDDFTPHGFTGEIYYLTGTVILTLI